MNYNIEFYKDGGKYCAYIGSDNGSGYKINADTIDQLTREIGDFFADEVEDDTFGE